MSFGAKSIYQEFRLHTATSPRVGLTLWRDIPELFFHQLRRDPRNGQDFRTRESAYGISLCWAIRRRLSRRLAARLLVHGTPQSSQVDWLVASTGAKPTSLGRGLERPISYPSTPSVIIPQGCSFARGCEHLEVGFLMAKQCEVLSG